MPYISGLALLKFQDQVKLNQFGLIVYNANFNVLVDIIVLECFSYLGQKSQVKAATQARFDISEASMKGKGVVDEKLNEGQTPTKCRED
ncbi:hypothetical protein AMTR_s00052p00165290 [Amborella trichopoda]|uniref:Uncharacterized protein n=1 Tax=Amborella trichopoda TaxID=13333 RepID=U5D2E8_AMBTC|nr:hypothetical protein AMTR_s00052p00165290 [Amborella trichopoda]